jgi:hypothetical protein
MDTLPSEIISHIFTLLTPQQILRCELVSLRWNKLADDPQLWHNYIVSTWGDCPLERGVNQKQLYFSLYQRKLREHELKRQERHKRRIESWNAGLQHRVSDRLLPIRRLDYSTLRLVDIEFVSLAHALSYAVSLLPVVFNFDLRKSLLSFAVVGVVRYLAYESYFDEEGTERRFDRKQAVFSALISGAILTVLKTLLERLMYTNYKRNVFSKQHGNAVYNPWTVSYYKYSLLCRISLTGVLSVEPIVQFPYILAAMQRIVRRLWSSIAHMNAEHQE